jgi:hypothetical protein
MITTTTLSGRGTWVIASDRQSISSAWSARAAADDSWSRMPEATPTQAFSAR